MSQRNYKSQDPAIRHMGPIAHDFCTAFGMGEDDTPISTIDADQHAHSNTDSHQHLRRDANRNQNSDRDAHVDADANPDGDC